jgi:hypothetical protein
VLSATRSPSPDGAECAPLGDSIPAPGPAAPRGASSGIVVVVVVVVVAAAAVAAAAVVVAAGVDLAAVDASQARAHDGKYGL